MIYRTNKIAAEKPASILLLIAKLGFFCVLFFSVSSYAQESALAVMSGDSRIYQKFYSSLKTKLHSNIVISQTTPDEIHSKTLDKYDYVISVGKNAARLVSQHPSKATIIYSLIPDDIQPEKNNPCPDNNCYKIYINQPVHRYAKLFKILFSHNRTLVFINTGPDTSQAEKLRSVSKSLGIKYKEINIDETSNIARTLIHKLNKNDVLLALPNPMIYNRNNAKNIILSTYHKNVPIIAYSKSFAKAGALISLYSKLENIAEETAALTNKISTDGQQTQKEYYPENFSIEINSAVSSSLDINITTKNDIKRKIK